VITDPRVLIDATAIPSERGGVGRYVDNIVAALDAAGAALSVVCQTRDAEVFAGLAPGSRVVPVAEELGSRPARLAWEQTTLPRLAKRLDVDVIHSPHYTMPLASPVPVAVTLHDATFFSDRGLHLGVKGRFFRAWTRTSLRRAAACIVPSQATADELVRYARARRSLLTVAYHGVDPARFHPPGPDEVRAVREHLGLGDDPWVAFLGTLEPRKNVPALIRGFSRFAADRTDVPALVLAGSPGWDSAIEPALTAAPPRLRVIRSGHLPVELLAGFLGGAEIMAYPSLGEGFGLPVLEGMASGACVLTTRRLSLPEVGGDAVAYTGVGAGEIAEQLALLMDDESRRAALGVAAVARAARFTWAASAAQHMEAFAAAARAGSPAA
jgi:glycosyltransferase involved in cell wall biosynthesis